MARRKTYKNYRKRKYPIWGKRLRGSVNKSMGTTPIPATFKTTLRYVDFFTLNPGALTPGKHVMSANGAYDPNITGGGHQPRGWDELIALYDHAVVIGSKITIQYANEDPTNPILVGITLKDTATTETNYNNYAEAGNTIYKQVGAQGSTGDNGKVSYSFNNKFLGIFDPMSEADVQNTSSTNPTEQAYYHVWAASPTGVDTSTVECTVSMEFIVVFKEPKVPTQS